jgi:hypothetical protein
MSPATLTFRELLVTDESDRGIWSELDPRSCAQVHCSSEHPAHPIDHLFDGSVGKGASRWVGGRRNRAETILLIFDEPVDIMRCAFEAEEREIARTQQVTAEYLLANGDVYRQCFIQEFSFSPEGATYQRERIDLDLRGVSRLRFTVLADKSARGVPSLTALRVFSFP